jgi:hypothetical protein
MAGNAQRDAKLSLKFDTTEATRGLSELEKATEEYARREKDLQAEIQKTTEVLERRVQARLGKLSSEQASSAVEALRKIKESGIESAGPDDVKAARRIAPEVVRAEQERIGRQSPAYQQLASMGIVGDSRRSQIERGAQGKFEAERAAALVSAHERDREKQQREAAAMAEDANRRRAIAGQSRDQSFRGAAGAISSVASGNVGGMLGSVMGAAGPAVLAAAAIGAFVKSIDLATVAVNTLRNADLTSAQKLNIIGDELTFGFTKKLRDLSNALDGTTERMRRADIRAEESRARTSTEGQHFDRFFPAQVARDTALARQQVLTRAVAAPIGNFDRMTASGEVRFQEAAQRQSAQDSYEAASRDAEVARANQRATRTALTEATEMYEAQRARRIGAQQRHDNLIRQENGQGPGDVVVLPGQDIPAGQRPGGPPGVRQQGARHEAGVEVQTQLEAERQALERVIQARENDRRAGVQSANEQMRARQQLIGVMQTELTILQQRDRSLSGAASRIGNMNFIDRRMGLNAAIQVQEQGVGNVTAEVRRRAQQFAPEWFENQAQRFAENTPEFQEGRRRGLIDPGGNPNQTIAEIRNEQTRIMQRMREETLNAQRENAREVGDILERGLRLMAEEFNQRLENVLNMIRNGRRIGQNQQG